MSKTAWFKSLWFIVPIVAAGILNDARAASAVEPATINMELNSLTRSQNDCTVNFIMRNSFENPVEALALEVVLFNTDGRIASILKLKVGALPAGKTKVKQFRFKSCADIARILINDVSECQGAGLSPKICMKNLKTANRTNIEFGL